MFHSYIQDGLHSSHNSLSNTVSRTICLIFAETFKESNGNMEIQKLLKSIHFDHGIHQTKTPFKMLSQITMKLDGQ